ncbi:replicative DNA helicase [Occultella kanbiaonis]|uniref:replicative DNA helicase n=1 Tax=Occultella kanbiaonis TaxID=2675754 RepID=UPI0013D7979A|nr:replicative DNA helicase [Occultella kanbiaonis]
MSPARESFERTPPQDVAAEQSVIGGMLLSKDAIADVVEVLRGTDFYRPAHEVIYDAILDLYGRGEPADAVTVSAELTKRGELTRIGGAPYLHTLLSSVPTAANAGYYARIVRERAVLRRLVDAGTRIVQLGYATDGGDVDELVNTAQAEVYAVTERRTAEDYVPLKDVINSTMEEIDAASHRGEGMVGVPTGFADLDALTNGLHPGQMIVLAARPAVGKALALDTPLPTPTGWTTMGEVAVGDLLIAADGTPTEVVAATDVMTDRPCYEVTFDDGTTIVTDAQHQWLTDAAGAVAVRTTERIAGDRRFHRIALTEVVQLPEAALPMAPYAAGVLIAGGSDDPVVRMRMEGLEVRGDMTATGAASLYVRGSEPQRRDFLAGLLDAVGQVDGDGRVVLPLADSSARLAASELVASLGHRVDVGPDALVFATKEQVFGLESLQMAHKERGVAGAGARTIIAVREVAPVPVRCVEIAHPNHLYLASRAMIPTHNSTMGLDVARAASIKNGQTSVIFSLEMSRNEIAMRMLSAESQVPLQNMRKGNMRDEDWTRMARAMGRVSEAPLFIDDSPNMSLMEIRAKCRRLKQRHDLKLVVIDYLQLMSSGKRVESRQQEVSEFSRALKLLAKELEVPVIAISQLNRGSEQRTDKKPQMSDLRESGSIEQDADVIILLHREDMYEKESPRAGEADMIVAKHRNGPTDTIVVAFQGHYARFVDMAQ